ncbi:AN1-type zinc finger protein 1-like [Sinocyclocheilus anshuiensis]|uniref:AN1-type zinc finger protein 1-like n=1 Tax=Sinocyclocheilus anshuiensis TaxID=1608454 RepID=UPI0007BABDF2|nr:PREDICTED: AN1-type zinc finger protein 1-like [Sinocyclocheilus anshuiensis]
MASVSLSLLMASWGYGPDRDRCLDLKTDPELGLELDELDELTLNIFEILLILKFSSGLRHRHQDDHKCEKLETPKPRMAATQELVQKIVESKKNAPPSKGRKGAKNAATAAKVALMKFKMHASGDKGLPQTERTYFQVFLPKEAKDPSLPMFFCSKWSVGKVVDFAASQASLKNNNNVLTAKKLRLCHPETGEAFKMDASLQSLLSHTDCPLHNGDNVILEYLDNKSSGLDDVTDYISSS